MTAPGLPSFTAISKPRRYISRSARWLTLALVRLRLSSWLLQAKCFSVTNRPGTLCTPLVTAAAILPDSSGSSE